MVDFKNVILGLLVLILGGLGYVYHSSPAPDPVPFESNAWKSGDLKTRAAMSKHLVDTDTLIGLTRQQVVRLLGSPQQLADSILAYQLDFNDSISPFGDPWIYELIVEFDNSDRVTNVSLTE